MQIYRMVYTCLYKHICIHIYIYIYIYMYVYIYSCSYIFSCICMYIYGYIYPPCIYIYNIHHICTLLPVPSTPPLLMTPLDGAPKKFNHKTTNRKVSSASLENSRSSTKMLDLRKVLCAVGYIRRPDEPDNPGIFLQELLLFRALLVDD